MIDGSALLAAVWILTEIDMSLLRVVGTGRSKFQWNMHANNSMTAYNHGRGSPQYQSVQRWQMAHMYMQ